jgi:WD40 repeat protein
MKLALAAIVVALSGAAPHAPVLGFDYGAKRITWYDPSNLAAVKGSALAWDGQLCSWSFSPDRRRLAVSDCNGTLKFFAVPSLKSLGKVAASSRVWDAASLAWLTPTRVLAVNRAGGSVATLLVVDTATKRVVRRVDLGGVVSARTILGNRVVLLVTPFDSFGPARVVVAGDDGALSTATIDGISAGSHFGDASGGEPTAEVRTPGFAVDPAGTAFVVGADLNVAAVDLATMHVTYHGPTRSLAKALNGTTRIAAWLGGGKVAVSGTDYATTGTGPDLKVSTTPFGLHLLDTSTWTYRTLDPAVRGLVADGPRIVASTSSQTSVYSASGAHLYDVAASDGSWLMPAQGHTYVCTDRWLTRVLDSATGAQITAPKNRGCPTLLAGRAAQY